MRSSTRRAGRRGPPPPLPAGTGDAVTLTLVNGPTFTYVGQGGVATPMFTATVVLGDASSPPPSTFVKVTIDGTLTTGNTFAPTRSADGTTYTFTRIQGDMVIPVGTHTAVAAFWNSLTNVTASSAPVTFTVVQATPILDCSTKNAVQVNSAGDLLQVLITFEGGYALAPVDWQDGTYTFRFVGEAGNDTFTVPNLVPDSQAMVTVPVPNHDDWYWRVDCIFNGTANWTSAASAVGAQPVLVSAKHPLGQVHFTSNPWPIVPNQTAQIDVKIDPTTGGPVPNGFFYLGIGFSGTTAVRLGPNGETSGTLPPATAAYWGGITQIVVWYQGDPYYDEGSVPFPMPAAPPPGGSGGGSGGGGGTGGVGGTGQPNAYPTSATTPSANGTARTQRDGTQLSQAGGSGNGTSSSQSSKPPALNIPSGLLWGGIAALVLIGAGFSGWRLLARRATRTVP